MIVWWGSGDYSHSRRYAGERLARGYREYCGIVVGALCVYDAVCL